MPRFSLPPRRQNFRGIGRPAIGRALGILLPLSLASVSCTRFKPIPIEPAQGLEDFDARRLDAPEIADFLVAREAVTQWPPTAWDLHSLTLAAFYYSPALDIARAKWGVARGGVITAGGRANPTLSTQLAFNSTTQAEEVTPWIPEGVLGLPIDLAGKRGIRLDEARQRSEAARYELLAEAWRVRSRVRTAFLGLYVAVRSDSILRAQFETREEIASILELRVAVGEVPPVRLARARAAVASSRVAALDAQQRLVRTTSSLAAALGVPSHAVVPMALSFDEIEHVQVTVPSAEVRWRALVSRSDILSALAEYEATQAALRLEIRKQYPDISLGPGFQLDQADAKWSLSLSLPLPFGNRNKGPIAVAVARREEAGARFLERQARVLADVDAALASVRAALDQAAAASVLQVERDRMRKTAQASYQVGEISRLEFLRIRAEVLATALSRIDALERAGRAVGALENAMQAPSNEETWVVEAPKRTSGPHGGAK
jgi:outer membrane protein, heavy metal efflux system